MELTLERSKGIKTDNSSISKLFVNGQFECYILEDKDRGLTDMMSLEQINKLKVYGETAIPLGKYEIDITMSNRFKRLLPLVKNVKGYDGIRIHTGNTKVDTHGCLLPCTSFTMNKGINSTSAFNKLYIKLTEAKALGDKITIEII